MPLTSLDIPTQYSTNKLHFFCNFKVSNL